jgi:hypothetical protein
MMKISNRSIQAIGRVITGDGDMSPYRSGPQLVSFFNEYGSNARYGQGFPSRWQFAENELHKLNGTENIKAAIEGAVDPRHYMETEFPIEEVIEHLNKYLIYDGYELRQNGLHNQICNKNNANIALPSFANKLDIQKGSQAFILEQIDKCKEKMHVSDYDGAITNARSMVEAVFEELLKSSGTEIPKHDGDLNKLFKDVKKNLNLDTNQPDLSDTLKQMLSGLNSIVTGIAGISNKMGDRHARKYKPAKHHALLAINTAYALCEFLLSSLEYQKGKDLTNV